MTFFTGNHRSMTEDIDMFNNINKYRGLIVVSTGKYIENDDGITLGKSAISINDAMPIVALSSVGNKNQFMEL